MHNPFMSCRLAAFLFVGSVISSGAGYAFARGAWKLPAAIVAHIPAPLLGRFGDEQRALQTSGHPSALSHYGFELVEVEGRRGPAVIDVRLVDKQSGRLIADAFVFSHRLDMAPDGMESMTARLEPQPAPQPGVYRFRTELAMEGGWRLSLAAKVQGENGTVSDQIALKVAP